MSRYHTIVAIASAPGRSARGLIRLSGRDICSILHKCLVPGADLGLLSHRRTLSVQRLADPSLPCLLASFPAPRSYTGQDSAEIQLPGNPDLLSRVVDRFIDAGARHAEPGEFTFRAFLNQRISLIQAEGVAATIAAASDAQLRAARMLTDGRIGRNVEAMRDRLAELLALVEAGIDFTDAEDVVPIPRSELDQQLVQLERQISAMLQRSCGAEKLTALPVVVISGPPNSGKSTLFNALLRRNRAIVSVESGTTRDALAEPMHLTDEPDSPEVMLIDVAGFDDAPTGLNPLMQQAAADAIARADLIIQLHPPDVPLPDSTQRHPTGSTLHVLTKCDLLHHSSDGARDPRSQTEGDRSADRDAGYRADILRISALTGFHLDELATLIAQRVRGLTTALASDALALLPRHTQALQCAQQDISAAREYLRRRAVYGPSSGSEPIGDIELVAADMRSALDALGRIVGDVTPDDVLGHIFAHFCVGK